MVFFINLSIHATFGGRIFFLSGLEKRKRQNIERTILTSFFKSVRGVFNTRLIAFIESISRDSDISELSP